MTKISRTLAIPALLALHITACAGDDDPAAAEGSSAAQLESCDPLRGEERPITLDNLIAVGRDADGVLYVLEDPEDGDYRVFVSEHGVLQRHRVLGSGTSSAPTWYSVDVEADPEFGLWVAVDASGETTMRRFDPATVEEKGQAPDGEDLDVLDESAIGGLKLRNLAPEVFIEYLGTIEDGRHVLVVRPNDDWAYEDFRVFLGAPNKMLEREVKNVVRARDGGSTTIDFTLDGKPATLDFPIVHLEPGHSTLESNGKTLSIALEEDPDEHAVGGLKFFCQ